MKKIVLIGFYLIATTLVFAQVEVSGKLKSSQGSPSTGIIALLHQEGEKVHFIEVDGEGRFIFQDVAAGTYQLEFLSPGTDKKATIVKVADNNVDLGEIRLKKSAISHYQGGEANSELLTLPKNSAMKSGIRYSEADVKRIQRELRAGLLPFEGTWEWRSVEGDSVFRIRLGLQEIREESEIRYSGTLPPAGSPVTRESTYLFLIGVYEYIIGGDTIVSFWPDPIRILGREDLKNNYLVGRNAEQDMFPRTARLALLRNPVGKLRGYATITFLDKKNTVLFWDMKGLVKDDRAFVLLRKDGLESLPFPSQAVLRKK